MQTESSDPMSGGGAGPSPRPAMLPGREFMEAAAERTGEIGEETFQEIRIPVGRGFLEGEISLPRGARGVVLFVHGSGSGRRSPRNQLVARMMHRAGLGTLLFDLLTCDEQAVDDVTRELRFDIDLLAARLLEVTRWLQRRIGSSGLRIGYFGASTGAAAGLVAAAELGDGVAAVVSRGGRPDLAAAALPKVRCPTLLIVGGHDGVVVSLNENALARLRCRKSIRVIPRATHLFEEPGALEEVARLAAAWFHLHFSGERDQGASSRG